MYPYINEMYANTIFHRYEAREHKNYEQIIINLRRQIYSAAAGSLHLLSISKEII